MFLSKATRTHTRTPRRGERLFSPVGLPVELIILIGQQLRRTQDFQKLRLVCKLFDELFAPIALSHVHLRSYPPVTLPGGASLRDVGLKHERLTLVKSLTIYSLEWLTFQPEGLREYCGAALCYLLLAPVHPLRRLFSFLSFSGGEVPPLNDDLASIQGIHYLKRLKGSILPNLERVKWYMQIEGPRTSRSLLLKALMSLPALKELDLSINLCNIPDLDEYTELLGRISGLQRLILRMHRGQSSCYGCYLRCFGRLIANNPDLSYLHLSWHDDAVLFPLQVLNYLPTDRPAQLKHLLLDTYNISIKPDVTPHLRSLQTLDVRWVPPPDFWETLANGGVFIPSIKAGFVTETLCEYLRLNKRLLSLTIARPSFLTRTSPRILLATRLFKTLETTNILEHLTISPFDWGRWYKDHKIEICLRRCTKLRRITLVFENGCLLVFKDIRLILRVVARLGERITLEVCGDDYIHRAFRSLTRDPALKNLQRQLEFSELQGYYRLDHLPDHSF